MNPKDGPWDTWRHITKLDPDKNISDRDLRLIAESGTDAVMVSGTQNITKDNVSALIERLRDYDIPKILEPSSPDAVLDANVDFLFVPLVLNAGDLRWIIGKHKDWIQQHAIAWDKVVPEAYIVMNPASAVAKVTQANTELTYEEVIAFAHYAEKYLSLPIIYLEYSGTYGNPILLKKLKDEMTTAALFYGGGIDSKARAKEMLKYADVIVVGNIVYSDFAKFLETLP